LRRARISCTLAVAATIVLLPIIWTAAAEPRPASDPKPSTVASPAIPKLWYSDASHKDFRVELVGDVFRADWVNLPPAAAKSGAMIHTECHKAGDKWLGTSTVKLLFGIPGAPAGKDVKLCPMTIRFEVDSITPNKITGHAEMMHKFDVNSCHMQQTTWGSFSWTPKK
jgi:hypothetical protein